MPRVTRGVADGDVYHVLNRGNGRQRVFHKDGDFAAFVELLGEARARHPVKIFSDCLIPNHFHLLLQADAGAELSRYLYLNPVRAGLVASRGENSFADTRLKH